MTHPDYEEKEPTVNEDLMREHGLLNRLLLIYEKAIEMIKNDQPFDHKIILTSAYIIRSFIEDHHEKMEEKYIFPVLTKANKHVDLVNELIKQHELGRKLTDKIIMLVASSITDSSDHPTNPHNVLPTNPHNDLPTNQHNIQPTNPHNTLTTEHNTKLATLLKMFVSMYRHHETREDTVVFVSFKNLLTDAEYDEIGELVEKEEEEMLGENSFEKILACIESLEIKLNIFDIAIQSTDVETYLANQ